MFCCYLCLPLGSYPCSVAISTDASAPDNSAMLDVKSTNRGMLVPRMTTAQRTAIATPASGLLVFDNTTGVSGFQRRFMGLNLPIRLTAVDTEWQQYLLFGWQCRDLAMPPRYNIDRRRWG
ncbi:MAG: hypothetical protein IPH20_23290 [Bacteroidales bacterium]|nr:hypothetical protein [Bacteroidales bacterium]